jgi:hypothetical protein
MSQRTFNTESIKVTATISFEIEGLDTQTGEALAKVLTGFIEG